MNNTDIIQISDTSELWPPLLREIKQPPTALFIRGNPTALLHEPLLAVVGSRKATIYGQQTINLLLSGIVEAGVPIVSGLAYGIDSMAHKLCLKQNQPTIAVLAGGVDDLSIYPRAHIKLAHQIIASGGAVISEYAPGSQSYLGNFPARNRIIAGLTNATLIVQAAARSGSLITARLALESGRDVAAVPGAIGDPLAVGTNYLIRDGAMPILEPDDLFTLLNLPVPAKKEIVLQLKPAQAQIMEFIGHDPIHVDELAIKTGQSTSTLAVSLTELELTDIIQAVGGMKYIRK